MKELSLNVLDITMNSVKAKATLINIHITENDELLTLEIIDNGCGMTAEFLRGVIDPFCTTRTTRKVGLGIPLLKLAAEQTGACPLKNCCFVRHDPLLPLLLPKKSKKH